MLKNGDRPLYELMHEKKQRELDLKKSKYDLILEFVNKIIDSEIKSLKDFKKIDINKIDMNQFEKIIEEYRYKLEGELEIDIDNINIDIVKILSDCLESIDYSLIKHKIKDNENKILLSIIDESIEEIKNKIKYKKNYL